MRLGTCIALELAVAGGGVTGLWIGAGHLVSGDYLSAPAAAAEGPRLAPEALPRSELVLELAPPLRTIFDAPDAALLAPIGTAPVTRVKINHGGTSLSFRVDFASGARAAFKPEQEVAHAQSDPRREIAAYRIDRLLGIGHVAPSKEVELPLDAVTSAIDPASRSSVTARILDEATVRTTQNGKVLRGEAQWWIPEIRLAQVGPYKIDDAEGRELWTAQLQAGATRSPELSPMLAQLSTLLVFDVVIDNADRWSGGNIRMSPDGKTLFFMDNTLSFSKAQFGREVDVVALHRISVFSNRLIGRLRAITRADLETAFQMPSDSKLAPLLSDEEIAAILSRRDHMLQWIDQLIERYGEDAVLAFP